MKDKRDREYLAAIGTIILITVVSLGLIIHFIFDL